MQQVVNLFCWFSMEPIRVLLPAIFILIIAGIRIILTRRWRSIRFVFAVFVSLLWMLYGLYETLVSAMYTTGVPIRIDIVLLAFFIPAVSFFALLVLIAPERSKRIISPTK